MIIIIGFFSILYSFCLVLKIPLGQGSPLLCCEVIKKECTLFILCTMTSLGMGSFTNHLKWPSLLCLCRMTIIPLGYPVLRFIPSTFLSQKHVSEWKPEIRLPAGSEYVVLNSLDWNTEYEIHVVAENQQGKSEPGTLSFRTAADPTTIPGTIPIIPPWASTHRQQPQCTKASTVTRRALLLRSMTITRCLFKACWLQGLSWIICLCLLHGGCIVLNCPYRCSWKQRGHVWYNPYWREMTISFAKSNRQSHVILWPVKQVWNATAPTLKWYEVL